MEAIVLARAAAWLLLAGALAGCGGDSGVAPGQATVPAPGVGEPGAAATTSTAAPRPSSRLDVSALEYQYDAAIAGDLTMAAGPVAVSLRNLGQEPHNAQLLRLREGVDQDEVARVAGEDPSGAGLLTLGQRMGGPGIVEPGTLRRSTQRLQAGSYLMFCLVRGLDGKAHAADGMVARFEVGGRAATVPAPASRPSAGLRLTDVGFDLPSPFPRKGVVRVRNAGTMAHEVSFLRLPAGRTAAAAAPYLRELRSRGPLQPPPPFPAAGGVAALDPGESADVAVDLAPGDYLAICLMSMTPAAPTPPSAWSSTSASGAPDQARTPSGSQEPRPPTRGSWPAGGPQDGSAVVTVSAVS